MVWEIWRRPETSLVVKFLHPQRSQAILSRYVCFYFFLNYLILFFYVQDCTLIWCMLLMTGVTKCPRAWNVTKTHINAVKYEVLWTTHFVMLLMPRSHYAEGCWKYSFISTVRPTVLTNPSWKRSFSKTLLKPEEFENARILVWTKNITKTELFESDDITVIMWLPSWVFLNYESKTTSRCCVFIPLA